MANQKGINRREFLKISSMSMTAGVLAGPNMAKLLTDDEVKATNDSGGFLIRYYDHDNPPYEVDDSVYKRMSSTDMALIRNPQKLPVRNQNVAKNIAAGEAGDDWLAYAYAAGAATFMFDNSMYEWEKLAASPSPFPKGRWIPQDNGYTVEDVSKIIKRSAKLYGASLVGIAPVDERWFYKDYVDLIPIISGGGGAMAMFTGDVSVDAPTAANPELEQIKYALMAMEAEDFKAMLLEVADEVDPALLPVPKIMMKGMPAAMMQEKLPAMIGNMDPAIAALLKEKIDPALLAEIPAEETANDAAPKPAPEASGLPDRETLLSILEGMKQDIVFSDDVDAPVITEEAKIIPRTMNRIIVMAFEMDEGGMDVGGVSHQVSQIGDASTMNGYSRMAFTSACLAQFIRRLGYNAVPMGNDHSLSVPMAVDAGLGELGRNGILITPKYGPRVRLAKVLTDLPLNVDRPITFGVTEFCEICGKCAEKCPSGAIHTGERTFDAPESGMPGQLNWPIEGDKCFDYWVEVGGSCYNCIRVCPFNKPDGWLHDATRVLIGARSGSLDKIMLKLDEVSGYGPDEGDPPEDFWDKDTYIHIKS